MWDKSKIYGYPDEVMLAGRPTDNEVAKKGCDEILTTDEIQNMFPNQIVVVEICDYDKIPEYWTTGRVLWYQCSLEYAFDCILNNSDPSKLLTYESTYSVEVGGLLNICFLDIKGVE